jgi:hypothetical protein
MPNISAYQKDSIISADDKVIGTDGTIGVDFGKTKNYTIGDITSFVVSNGFSGNVSLGNIEMNGSVTVDIRHIDAVDNGVDPIAPEDHYNFISYVSPNNGTHTLTLPAATQGLILRFNTDLSISNSKTILLRPLSGETIDGAIEYEMDRPYDGITLLAHRGNWYVIQKKEK